MKVALIGFLFAVSAFAQNPSAVVPLICGSGDVNYKVKLDSTPQTQKQPESGKALVYFIHDAGTSAVFAYPTTKIGVDGAWVGANHSNSYFSIAVEPGEHHVCAALQSSLVDDRSEFAHFTAEAGKIYYYRTRLVMSREVELLELDPIDSDQGKYLIANYPLSVSHEKNSKVSPTAKTSGTPAAITKQRFQNSGR
jgi:hypothetical protein